MNPVKLAIIGSRGIPNHYGGFEQLAQFLAVGLVQKGMDVTVYNSHRHPYREKTWNGVRIEHCYDAEHRIGTAGQFIYDFNCIRDARKKKFDAWLFLGYTSSSVWHRLFDRHAVIISNMDGLEWKRSKYSKRVQRFLQQAEKLAAHHSHQLVADSPIIQAYLKERYQLSSTFIPYGAEIAPQEKTPLLPRSLNLTSGEYLLVMARMEPENNIEMILEGYTKTAFSYPLVVIGNYQTKQGLKWQQQFSSDKKIVFAGAVYDPHTTHWLRQNCLLYFHGHSVGGTNPSLLEAMADGCTVAAHNNPFNQAVLGADAFYFRSADEVAAILEQWPSTEGGDDWKKNNLKKIEHHYNWPAVIEQYHQLVTESVRRFNHE